jgi:hypothetical protein
MYHFPVVKCIIAESRQRQKVQEQIVKPLFAEMLWYKDRAQAQGWNYSGSCQMTGTLQ